MGDIPRHTLIDAHHCGYQGNRLARLNSTVHENLQTRTKRWSKFGSSEAPLLNQENIPTSFEERWPTTPEVANNVAERSGGMYVHACVSRRL